MMAAGGFACIRTHREGKSAYRNFIKANLCDEVFL